MARTTKSWRDRFVTKFEVDAATGCWNWRGSVCKHTGYGQLWRDGRNVGAHRCSWEVLRGPIPDGLQIDHLCRNRRCVNPKHLEPVSGRTNVLRGDTVAAANLAKTHCPKGHAYEGGNLYSKGGRRSCRECGRVRWRQYWHNKLKPSRLQEFGQTMKPENRKAAKARRKEGMKCK